jgi:hypothetical protein
MEGSYQHYVRKLESNIHVGSFDEYNALNNFRCNNYKKPLPKVQLSPNSMLNSFDDISSNLRSHIVRSIK